MTFQIEKEKMGNTPSHRVNHLGVIYIPPPWFSSAILVLLILLLQFSQTGALPKKEEKKNEGE